MTEVLQANIFFIITSIAVVLFTLILCVILYHVLKITKSIRRIVERIEEGSEVLAEDMSQIREYVSDGSIFTKIIGIILKRQASKKRRSKKD